MRDRDGSKELDNRGNEERQKHESRTDGLHPISGGINQLSRIISKISETPDSIGSTFRSNETGVIDETWFEPIDETSPKMRMAGPEVEKQEVTIRTEKSVLPWDQITEILDKHMEKKEETNNEKTIFHAFDIVDRPRHYASGNIECIDAIEAQLSNEEFRGYLKGNIIKYLWREKHKGGVESLKKAQWYLNKLLG
jgi:hypothetical protein